jgi:hypothetical protein
MRFVSSQNPSKSLAALLPSEVNYFLVGSLKKQNEKQTTQVAPKVMKMMFPRSVFFFILILIL